MARQSANNFDTLRIVAALAVLISHAFALTTGSDATEPLYRLTGGEATIGGTAVCVFFAISGYLITRSFLRTSDPVTFIAARALRLYPALLVMLLVIVGIAGPILTRLPPGAYFIDPVTWRHLSVTLSLLASESRLPGVFENLPYPGSIDGSLWTLVHEVRCYAVVLVLGIAGVLKRGPRIVLPMIALLLLAAWRWAPDATPWFYTAFAAGMALCCARLPLNGWVALGCAVLCAASVTLGGYRMVTATFGTYAVLWLALTPRVRLPDLARWGDMSYGLYIWAFPVQQLTVHLLGNHGGWALNIAASLPIALALSWLSWRFIEAPALRWKTQWSLSSIGEHVPEMLTRRLVRRIIQLHRNPVRIMQE